VPTLLPHRHTLNPHCAIILPSRQPLILRLPEVKLSPRAAVNPRLTALAILEPAVCRADSQVEHEVEVLVERRRVALGVRPGIVETRAVGVGEREVAVLEEGLVEVRVHDLQQARVDVGEDVLLTPLCVTRLATDSCVRWKGRSRETYLDTKRVVISGIGSV
jgi:hypothetical protein